VGEGEKEGFRKGPVNQIREEKTKSIESGITNVKGKVRKKKKKFSQKKRIYTLV